MLVSSIREPDGYFVCSNIQTTNSDSHGPVGHWAGWFRPPVTSNYTFIVDVDDYAMLWIGHGPASAGFSGSDTAQMELLVDVPIATPRREWCPRTLSGRFLQKQLKIMGAFIPTSRGLQEKGIGPNRVWRETPTADSYLVFFFSRCVFVGRIKSSIYT